MPSRLSPLILLFLACTAIPARSQGVLAPAPALPASGVAFQQGAGWFTAASAVGVAASTFGDGWAWRQAQGPEGPQTRGIARLAGQFGNPLFVGPALLASYATGRLTGRTALSAGSARVAGATLGAAALCVGLKVTVGRVRPAQAPGDPDDFRPLRLADTAFPSGHTTVAFAAASAIHAETRARWVPWVVYPVAGAVGWSRVRENEHWLSDVTAGAALGIWAGRRLDALERGHLRFLDRTSFLARGSRRNFRVGFQTRF